ncbi:MAG: hypothetical protein ACRCX2_35150 [Paraclostridium sp.]
MNLKRKVIIVEHLGEKFEMILDFESAIEFEDLYGKSIFEGIKKISTEQNIKALACLLASCLKKNGKCVGMDFVKGMDLMANLEFFMTKLGELMDNSLDTDSEENVQKKTNQKRIPKKK